MITRRIGAAAFTLALAAGLAACGSDDGGGDGASGGGDSIKIGIKFDQPGLGQKVGSRMLIAMAPADAAALIAQGNPQSGLAADETLVAYVEIQKVGFKGEACKVVTSKEGLPEVTAADGKAATLKPTTAAATAATSIKRTALVCRTYDAVTGALSGAGPEADDDGSRLDRSGAAAPVSAASTRSSRAATVTGIGAVGTSRRRPSSALTSPRSAVTCARCSRHAAQPAR